MWKTNWEMLKPLVTRYVTMVILSALTHVTCEDVSQRGLALGAGRRSRPLRPNVQGQSGSWSSLAWRGWSGGCIGSAQEVPKLYP